MRHKWKPGNQISVLWVMLREGEIINYRQTKSNEMKYWWWKCLKEVRSMEDIRKGAREG